MSTTPNPPSPETFSSSQESSSSSSEVLRVGTPAGALPGSDLPLGEEKQGDSTSAWWSKRPATPAPLSSGSPVKTPLWNTTAREELGRFRGLPVVGRLPWRGQYILAFVVLAAALCSLLATVIMLASNSEEMARQASAELTLRQALQSLSALREGDSPEDFSSSRLDAFLSQGRLAMESLTGIGIPAQQMALADLGNQWRNLDTGVKEFLDRKDVSHSVVEVSKDLQPRLSELISQMVSVLSTNASVSPSLRQVLVDLQDWNDSLGNMVDNGTPWPQRLTGERQRVEQSLRAFAASPEARQDSPETQSWRVLAGAWSQVQPRMDDLIAKKNVWDAHLADVFDLGRRLDAIHQSLNSLSATAVAWQGSQVWLRRAAWSSGGFTAVALFLLFIIAWKQHRFQIIQSKVSQEQADILLLEIAQELKEMAEGDLTRRDSPLSGILGESLAHAKDRLRRIFIHMKKAVEQTVGASAQANEATVVLVDEARNRAARLEDIGSQVLSLAEGVRASAKESRNAAGMATALRERAEQGAVAVEAVRGQSQGVRSRLEEVIARARRISVGTDDQSKSAVQVAEMAEEADVIAAQASIMATKAGSQGLPFQKAADNMRNLADRLTVTAQRLSSHAGTARADAEAMGETLETAVEQIDDSARLNEVAHESLIDVSSRMNELSGVVSGTADNLREQEEGMLALENISRQELERVSESRHQAQQGADSVMVLINTMTSLGDVASKLRV